MVYEMAAALCRELKVWCVSSFFKRNNMLCFLAVVPVYRRQHIARQMVSFMLTLMKDGEDITITAS